MGEADVYWWAMAALRNPSVDLCKRKGGNIVGLKDDHPFLLSIRSVCVHFCGNGKITHGRH